MSEQDNHLCGCSRRTAILATGKTAVVGFTVLISAGANSPNQREWRVICDSKDCKFSSEDFDDQKDAQVFARRHNSQYHSGAKVAVVVRVKPDEHTTASVPVPAKETPSRGHQ